MPPTPHKGQVLPLRFSSTFVVGTATFFTFLRVVSVMSPSNTAPSAVLRGLVLLNAEGRAAPYGEMAGGQASFSWTSTSEKRKRVLRARRYTGSHMKKLMEG